METVEINNITRVVKYEYEYDEHIKFWIWVEEEYERYV